MNVFIISVPDEPGSAARIFEVAAAAGVNINPAYGLANGRTGILALGSPDEAGLRAALGGAGIEAQEYEGVVTEVEDRPGTGAALFRRLADAGVDLRAAVPVGMSGGRLQLALAATDAAGLKRALGS
ncbi:MAG TPA: hypothetical protein VEY67_10355 [Candidatus Dormibacteraeota bacterium]|nr:hypothetical protein [Candidatus Dormibacteraeota bacterium]